MQYPIRGRDRLAARPPVSRDRARLFATDPPGLDSDFGACPNPFRDVGEDQVQDQVQVQDQDRVSRQGKDHAVLISQHAPEADPEPRQQPFPGGR